MLQEQQKNQKMQTSISVGATILTALMGRKAASRSTLGRATTSARGASRIMKEAQDVKMAEENIKRLKIQFEELKKQLTEQIEDIKTETDPLKEELQSFLLRPKKKNISVDLVTLAWIPFWEKSDGSKIIAIKVPV